MNCPKCDTELKCPKCGGPMEWPNPRQTGVGPGRLAWWTAGIGVFLLFSRWLGIRPVESADFAFGMATVSVFVLLPLALALGAAAAIDSAADRGRRSLVVEVVVILLLGLVLAAVIFPIFAKCR